MSARNAFVREALRLSDLHHPNIVPLLGTCLSAQPYCLILEYQQHGDLKALLRRCQLEHLLLDGAHLVKWAVDVTMGFEYLQQVRFVHRDIAARNVMVSGGYDAKIADFGMARRLYNSEYYSREGMSDTEGSLVLPIRLET